MIKKKDLFSLQNRWEKGSRKEDSRKNKIFVTEQSKKQRGKR